MNIIFTLDEDGEIDPNEPVGNITITDGKTTLLVESTYLDSWFDAFIDGLNGLQKNKKLTLDIIEEPESIIFERLAQGLKITYGKQELVFDSLNEFYQSLLASAKYFLSQLHLETENLGNFPILFKIYDFIEQSSIQQPIINTVAFL